MRRDRRGFTLVELLVVIGILVLLTTMIVWGVANTRSTDKARSAARTAQSAFLGARDRAVHAKEMRGLRLLRDPNNFTIVNGFQYVRPLPVLTYGGTNSPIQILRPDVVAPTGPFDADTADATILAGLSNSIDWWNLDSNGFFDPLTTRVRIPAGANGQWYRLIPINNSAPYFVLKNGGAQFLKLATAFSNPESPGNFVIAVDWNSPQATLDLQLGNELIPLTEPISMSSGMVIDLEWSSTTAKVLAIPKIATDPIPAIDIMFSPRGGVTGPIAVGGPIHFLLTDLQDASALDDADAYDNSTGRRIPDGSADNPRRPLSPIDRRNRGEKLVLTIFPQTGNVQTFPIDPTDVVDNVTGASGPDGLADDLFRFARLGSAAAN